METEGGVDVGGGKGRVEEGVMKTCRVMRSPCSLKAGCVVDNQGGRFPVVREAQGVRSRVPGLLVSPLLLRE